MCRTLVYAFWRRNAMLPLVDLWTMKQIDDGVWILIQSALNRIEVRTSALLQAGEPVSVDDYQPREERT